MKKIVLIFMFIVSFLKADIVSDRVNLIKKLSAEQDYIANIIELYVELYGNNPTLSTLKSSGLLDNSFNFSYSTNFNISSNVITINSNLGEIPEAYQRDFYLNNFARGRVVNPTVSSNIFTTTYYLSKEATNTKSYIGVVNHISPLTPAVNSGTWYNTKIKKILFFNSGTWQSLDTKKLWIVKSTSELKSLSASENDGGIVLTTTSLDKYLYVSNSWVKIENVPFNYNTGF